MYVCAVGLCVSVCVCVCCEIVYVLWGVCMCVAGLYVRYGVVSLYVAV